ncbi:unnamed protein product [Lymnaea stagnalis]|uniref:C-type lectin domain-containing protein n=1 Tax=Lymnaea stagnalis TaxID=6523 RepID=A0AAV2H916_LYMST
MHLGILTIGLNLIFLVQCAVSSPCFFWTSALYSNGYCYKFESTQLNWTDAKAYCSGSISQAKLADGDNADWDYVIRTINQTNQEWWIDGELSLLQCAKLMYTSSRSVVPSFEKCETKREFICQLYVGDPCETALSRGEYFNDGNCYALYHSTKVFFDAANETCAVKESRLAEFFSMEAYYYFRNRMNYLIGSLSDPSIFLGGSDLLHEGVFTWFSTDTNISINDWIPNEPNNGNTGEHHLSWRVVTGEEFHLNDVNGTDKKGFAICQKDVLNITYLIVLPDSDVSVVKSSVIQVTSGDLEVTYLHFTQRLNDMQVNTTYDWVTSYHDVIYTVDSTIEMSGTGIYRGVVQLRANHHVTVVLHQTSGSEVGTTLVFPVDLVTTGYFVLTNASQESGSQITITALNSDTDVTVKLPRKQLQPFTISVGGFTIQHADKATIHLDQLDTAHLQSSEDFSGSFVYATKPVVVYSGSKNVQTAENTWDHTLDMSVPVDSLSTEYVTFPSSSSASDTFRLLALYDDTEIAVRFK